MHRTLLALGLAITAFAPAHAALLTYTNKAAFLTATASTDATGALPNLGSVGATPITVGSITYSPVATIIYSGHYSTVLPGNVIGLDYA